MTAHDGSRVRTVARLLVRYRRSRHARVRLKVARSAEPRLSLSLSLSLSRVSGRSLETRLAVRAGRSASELRMRRARRAAPPPRRIIRVALPPARRRGRGPLARLLRLGAARRAARLTVPPLSLSLKTRYLLVLQALSLSLSLSLDNRTQTMGVNCLGARAPSPNSTDFTKPPHAHTRWPVDGSVPWGLATAERRGEVWVCGHGRGPTRRAASTGAVLAEASGDDFLQNARATRQIPSAALGHRHMNVVVCA